MYGKELDEKSYEAIINDIVREKYSNIFLASFIGACAGNNMTIKEICYLTKAMIASGTKLQWDTPVVMDKHCIGGLPGNRTTMIVVPIVTSLGITMPKTSSRAITSPAGTADVMEAVAPVTLDTRKIKEVVHREGGCIAWGGSVKLSPADDILIRVERALDIDSEGQMIASILSKKAAAGSTHVLIDIPVGPTAKIRTPESASRLSHQLYETARYIGINIKVLLTDGTQPVGNGIGPALEASDVLSVLRNEKNAPRDLRDRSLLIASEILEQSGRFRKEEAWRQSEKILTEGKAFEKFIAICNAQGGFREPARAAYTKDIHAGSSGTVTKIDTRRLARVAKLAGAPSCPSAGLYLHKHLNDLVNAGEAIITLHAESKGELEYALNYLETQVDVVRIDGE
jgi:thymidine phosphorylase